MKFIERFSRKASVRPVAAGDGQPLLLMALEPRIMFDASVGVVAQDAAQATAEPAKDSTSADQASQQDSQVSASADTRSTQNDQRHEVVFVDGQVADVGKLLEGLSGNAEVVILDPNKDGLQQMADYLKGREGLDAIHLLSHGADGTVQMGNLWLATNNLAEHREALQSIGAALKADGDLMLYGCNVGESGQGQAFLDQLAQITGADVAASADDTGAASLGGNWTLERSSGVIETTALGAQLEGYDGLLAATFTGGSNPTAPTLLSGQLPRYVVGDFNNDGRDDILYQIGGDNTAWKFAAGNADGTFSIVDQIASPFANVTLINAATNGTNYYAADFDKDGDIDLLGVTVTSGAAYLYRNVNGVFTREVATGFNGTQYGVRLVVGDFNGDGAADILYQPGNVDAGNAWRYALNNGDGTFTDMVQSASPFAAFTLATYSSFNYRVIDFDGDGDLDILYQANNSTGALYLNNGNNTFSQASTAAFPVPAYGPRTLWGDFDGDGDADVFWQVGVNGTDWNYATNNGDGTFTIVSRANSPFAGLVMTDYGVNNFRIGDFDGDGDTDVIGSSPTTNAFVYYQAGSPPTLVSATPADNSLNVSPSANIVLTFSQSVTKGTGNIYIVRTSDNQIVQTIQASSSQVTGSGTTWTIDPSDLDQGTAYAVRIDNKAFANADGKVFKGISNNTTLNFTTSTVQPPVIGNFNGDAVAYNEGAAYVLLDDGGNATVTDADSANFSGGKLTVQVTTGLASGEDVLFIRDEVAGANKIILSGASIMYNGLVIGTYTGGSNGNPLVVTFTSNANPTTVAALVHNLAYRNSNGTEPSTTPRTVSVSMDDGAGGNSTVSTILIEVHPVNDPPVVNVSASNPTYTENTSAVQLFSGATVNTVESGQKVIQMTFSVSGVANGAAEKLVIDGSDVTLINGTSLVTNGNSVTVTVSVTSGTANVTLSTSAGLDAATAQTIINTMAYRNDSESPNTANRVVTLNTLSDNGGTDNGGIPTIAVGIASTVTVVGINDAPVLAGGPYSLPSINEDTTSSGTQISTLLTNYTMVDPDVSALRGIAVITKSGNGIWQYSTDNANWTDFGAVSSTSALLLASTTYIRYVPDGANGETASLTFRGWDQTTGMASVNGIRGTADTSSNGGTTAFSTVTAVANQPVTSVNDAPVMVATLPTLTGLNDTSTNNAGNLVSSLTGGITDVDTGALKGIAITGLTGTYGKWQYSTDAGTSWTDIGSVSNTTALVLNTTNKVRYVPDGVHGETATIIYKAWDQTGGTAGLEGTKRDTTVSGGVSAYSTDTDTASVVVTAVNDAPVVTVSGGSASWTEGNNVASTPVVVDAGLTLVDADGPNPLSASARMLTYFSAQDTLSFVNDGLTMGNIVGTWTVGTGTLTLTSAGNQATVAQFEAAMRAITYNNASNSPNSTTRTVQFIVTDGSNAQSTAVTRDVTITAVNDSPTISAVASLPITEDTQTALGQITFSDVDTTLGVATFSVGSGTLSAIGAGGVTVGGDGDGPDPERHPGQHQQLHRRQPPALHPGGQRQRRRDPDHQHQHHQRVRRHHHRDPAGRRGERRTGDQRTGVHLGDRRCIERDQRLQLHRRRCRHQHRHRDLLGAERHPERDHWHGCHRCRLGYRRTDPLRQPGRYQLLRRGQRRDLQDRPGLHRQRDPDRDPQRQGLQRQRRREDRYQDRHPQRHRGQRCPGQQRAGRADRLAEHCPGLQHRQRQRHLHHRRGRRQRPDDRDPDGDQRHPQPGQPERHHRAAGHRHQRREHYVRGQPRQHQCRVADLELQVRQLLPRRRQPDHRDQRQRQLRQWRGEDRCRHHRDQRDPGEPEGGQRRRTRPGPQREDRRRSAGQHDLGPGGQRRSQQRQSDPAAGNRPGRSRCGLRQRFGQQHPGVQVHRAGR
ncbi:DUF4347 domain-containing protein [Pseudomonas japonica]|uniref:DUF4347 domain-containing protein n=1 Tax=Pseudomonas japonica TaxID=256466 RepID=UPI003A86CC47